MTGNNNNSDDDDNNNNNGNPVRDDVVQWLSPSIKKLCV